MKISAIIGAGCLSLALGAWTSAGAAQQTQPQAPTSGGSQVGSGGGVNTDPATQRATDRAGQTPRPAGPSQEQPSGSVGTDQGTPRGTSATSRGGDAQGGTGTEAARTDKTESGASSQSGTQDAAKGKSRKVKAKRQRVEG